MKEKFYGLMGWITSIPGVIFNYVMNRKKIFGLIALAVFAMLQILACFVAGAKTEGFISFIFFLVGGISCLFGIALDFLLFLMAVDVFSSLFASLAKSIVNRGEEEEEDEEEIEVDETPEE